MTENTKPCWLLASLFRPIVCQDNYVTLSASHNSPKTVRSTVNMSSPQPKKIAAKCFAVTLLIKKQMARVQGTMSAATFACRE